jgi:hypothetical protein
MAKSVRFLDNGVGRLYGFSGFPDSTLEQESKKIKWLDVWHGICVYYFRVIAKGA